MDKDGRDLTGVGFEVKESKASYGRGSKWKASSSPPGRMG